MEEGLPLDRFRLVLRSDKDAGAVAAEFARLKKEPFRPGAESAKGVAEDASYDVYISYAHADEGHLLPAVRQTSQNSARPCTP